MPKLKVIASEGYVTPKTRSGRSKPYEAPATSTTTENSFPSVVNKNSTETKGQQTSSIPPKKDIAKRKPSYASYSLVNYFSMPYLGASHYVLVPIATIGCGKTTIAIALNHLFGWKHVQNDDMDRKKNEHKKGFIVPGGVKLRTKTEWFVYSLIEGLLHPNSIDETEPNKIKRAHVVFADRNNHMFRERKQLFNDIEISIKQCNEETGNNTSTSNVSRLIKFIGIHFKHNKDPTELEKLKNITRQRILSRGNNHQTIKREFLGDEKIEEIMSGFCDRFQAPVRTKPTNIDSRFDHMIEIDVSDQNSSRKNLEFIIKDLHAVFPDMFTGELPSQEDIDKAIGFALKT
ncbi:hypothetical protein NADFUDRAFT_53134 [Nadsonia fulvescens var. elongata DSM 6958]|uniref:tRNA ligase n=1 Tax=Nadsonia fulvescens var. elongata DSM 6958 TaxID=857566 RepID=A0A1E3PDH8_9ASCO|nr:hypothetical protein NADFUDRAFT_53134 [Nadsonia fulvescens var. elongata DSM 6958]